MRNRPYQIIVRLNDEELLMLRKKLKLSGLSMSRYFRVLIEQEEIKLLSEKVLPMMLT